ncbi:MAG: PAS domain-containing protein [Burkholderiales bacterium]
MSSSKPAPEARGSEIRFSAGMSLRWTTLGTSIEALTGRPAHDYAGQAVADLLHAEDRDYALQTIGSVLKGELYSCRLPVRLAHAGERAIWIELYASPSFGANGMIDGLAGTLTDVTDRRKGMRALRESEARFRAISEASPLGVCVTDLSGDSVFSNSVLQSLADLNPEKQAGFSQGLTIAPEDRARVLAGMREAFDNKGPFQSEHRYVHRDGTVLWCRLHAAPILDAGQLLGYVHVAEDVTAERRGEEALHRSQERLHLALEGSGVALMDWDLRTSEIFLSEHWARFRGVAPGQSVTSLEEFLALVHEEDQDRVQLAIKETLSGQRPYLRCEYRIRTHDDEWKWVETHARVVERSESGDPMRLAGTNADITERKDFERRQAEFVATVSHELRSPLTSILGALEVVEEESANRIGEQAHKFLGVAHKNTERLFALVNDILDLEKIERGLQSLEFASVALRPLLEQVLDLHAAIAQQRQVGLVLASVPQHCNLWTDAERLTQVLTNLLSNALQFSPPGSCVTVHAEQSAERVRIEVIDQGPGIPAEFQARMFQRFAQAGGAKRTGSGLGLSISKALVERLEGEITYRTGQGSGTTFVIDLPRATPVSALPRKDRAGA